MNASDEVLMKGSIKISRVSVVGTVSMLLIFSGMIMSCLAFALLGTAEETDPVTTAWIAVGSLAVFGFISLTLAALLGIALKAQVPNR